MKIITILLLVFASYLNAKDVTSSELNDIYTEAILFVAVFAIMGLISFIYSKKHAKEYKKKEKVSPKPTVDTSKEDRIVELSKMLDNDILTKKEFELLNRYYRT